jgi:integrase
MSKVAYQKKVRSITKEVTLLRRYWESSSGLSNSFRARIWQPKLKKYAYMNLDADNEKDAINETLDKWSERRTDIKEGRDIASKNRKLETFINEFVDVQKVRANDKQITVKRADVIGYHLVCLTKFWVDNGRPTLDELSRLYELEWQNYRSTHRAQKTGKIISARTRNNETNTHKMFFRWCEKKRYSSRIPEMETLKVERTNSPFPQEYYQKLLAVTRKGVKDGRNPRIRWELMNYRYVILLMAGIGCRVLECKNLRWRDIDVRKTGVYLYINGKGKERTIRIPDRVYGHLMDLRKYKEENYPNYNSTEFPHIFNTWKSPKATNHYSGQVRRRWMKETGMPDPDDYELVCFRHKFITDALNNGAHSLTIATYCGTSQLMIEKTYSGLVAAQVYDLVFKNTPEEALERKKTPKWLELSEEENTSVS